MNINVLSLSVLAREKGHGPQFHRGNLSLFFLFRVRNRHHTLFDVHRAYFKDYMDRLLETLDVSSMTVCVSVHVLQKSKTRSWYLDYLFTQGYDGLKHFVHSNISWKSAKADI